MAKQQRVNAGSLDAVVRRSAGENAEKQKWAAGVRSMATETVREAAARVPRTIKLCNDATSSGASAPSL